MTNPEINWDDPAAVEAALQQEGLGDIDKELRSSKDVHIGVGRQAMAAASENSQDAADFEEDTAEEVNLDDFMQ